MTRALELAIGASLLAGLAIEVASDTGGGAIAIGVVSAVMFALILVLLPRLYEIWTDRLVLVFLWHR
jgi:hypothetical protein